MSAQNVCFKTVAGLFLRTYLIEKFGKIHNGALIENLSLKIHPILQAAQINSKF